MIDDFKIYVDRLKKGLTQKIEGSYSPDLLDIQEDELEFNGPVAVRAEAYVAEEHLVIQLAATTVAEMPCAICNEIMKKNLSVANYTHTENLSEIKGTYDAGTLVREALLLELPYTVECNDGNCPARKIYLGE